MAESNFDIEFKEQKMRELKTDIDTELIQVKTVLREVADVCNSDPAEDDTILVEIQKIGNDLHKAWGGLVDAFDKVTKKIGEIFNIYHDTADKQQKAASQMDRSL